MNALKRFVALWIPALCVAAAAAALTHTVFGAKIERLLVAAPAQPISPADILLLAVLSVTLAAVTAAYPLWARSGLFAVLGLEYFGLAAVAAQEPPEVLWFTPALVLIVVYYCAANVLLPWIDAAAAKSARGATGLAALVSAQLDRLEPGLRLEKIGATFGPVRVDVLAKDASGRLVMILCQPDTYANTLVKALDLKFFLDSRLEHRIIVLIPHKEEGLKEHLIYFSGMPLAAFAYTLAGENQTELNLVRVDSQIQSPVRFGRIARRQPGRPARRHPPRDSALTREEIDRLLGNKV